LAHNRLVATLTLLPSLRESGQEFGGEIASALSDSWTIVDTAHRLRQLVDQMPGISKKDPSIQLFLRGTRIAEDLRNYVQHLRGEMDNLVALELPVWGTLSWRSAAKPEGAQFGHIIIPGTFYQGLIMHGPTYGLDRRIAKEVERIELAAGGHCIIIDEVVSKIKGFGSWVEKWIGPQFEGHDQAGSDAFFSLKFTPIDATPAQPSPVSDDEGA
jgi:hypothetical protein